MVQRVADFVSTLRSDRSVIDNRLIRKPKLSHRGLNPHLLVYKVDLFPTVPPFHGRVADFVSTLRSDRSVIDNRLIRKPKLSHRD